MMPMSRILFRGLRERLAGIARSIRAMSLGQKRVSVGVAASIVFACFAFGCRDKGKISAEEARNNVQRLVTLAVADVAEIERGLPEGAAKMGALLAKPKDPDAKDNSAQVRAGLLKIRRQVPDLGVAKSTFFAFTDDKGIAIRNDLEQDTMAGKDIVAAYPDFKKALAGESFVATQGAFPGVPNPHGPDREWVAAVPVKRDDQTLVGLLVTGWTYRRFAYHLQEVLKRDLQERVKSDGQNGKLPVVYVFLFDHDHVYGAQGTPPMNEKALEDLHLVEKTSAGETLSPILLDGRDFGWAAARVSKLGADVGIVVLRSEI
jgi:hypothetical protein